MILKFIKQSLALWIWRVEGNILDFFYRGHQPITIHSEQDYKNILTHIYINLSFITAFVLCQ